MHRCRDFPRRFGRDDVSGGSDAWRSGRRLRRALAAETDALRRSEKLAAAGQLAAVVAHEINNPLEAVVNLQFLLQQEPLSPHAHKLLDEMAKELDRVCNIPRRTLHAFTPQ